MDYYQATVAEANRMEIASYHGYVRPESVHSSTSDSFSEWSCNSNEIHPPPALEHPPAALGMTSMQYLDLNQVMHAILYMTSLP